FYSNATTTPQLYPLSLHDALPILTSPTCPRSRPSCTSLRARIRPPSLPERPTASALPLPLSKVTSSVLMEPVTLLNGNGSALARSEEHTSELQSQSNLVCRLLLEK